MSTLLSQDNHDVLRLITTSPQDAAAVLAAEDAARAERAILRDRLSPAAAMVREEIHAVEHHLEHELRLADAARFFLEPRTRFEERS